MDWFGVSVSAIGVAIICAGWIIQLLRAGGKQHELTTEFLAAYAAGVVLIFVDAFAAGALTVAAFNFLALVLSLMVLLKLGLEAPAPAAKPAVAARKRR